MPPGTAAPSPSLSEGNRESEGASCCPVSPRARPWSLAPAGGRGSRSGGRLPGSFREQSPGKAEWHWGASLGPNGRGLSFAGDPERVCSSPHGRHWLRDLLSLRPFPVHRQDVQVRMQPLREEGVRCACRELLMVTRVPLVSMAGLAHTARAAAVICALVTFS